MFKRAFFLIFCSIGFIINCNSQTGGVSHILQLSENNYRNSEGDFIKLKTGEILFVYSNFTTGHADNSPSFLNSVISSNKGKSWKNGFFQKYPEEKEDNLMSVSLLRLKNNKIAMFYLKKTNKGTTCIPYMIQSNDEGSSWTEPKRITETENGFYVLNNDRVIQLKTGRLIVPIADHYCCDNGKLDPIAKIYTYYSDDNGLNWIKSYEVSNLDMIVLQEPGIVELDKSLLMFIRTDSGYIYQSFSYDDGVTWQKATKSSVKSPLSPASIKKIPNTNKLMMIWNDSDITYNKTHRRSPLSLAISEDNANTWLKIRNIEEDPLGHYCYCSINFVDKNKLLLSYCAGHKENGKSGLELTKIVQFKMNKILKQEN